MDWFSAIRSFSADRDVLLVQGVAGAAPEAEAGMGVRLSRQRRAHQLVPVADRRDGLLRRGRCRPLQRGGAQPEALSRTHGGYQVVS